MSCPGDKKQYCMSCPVLESGVLQFPRLFTAEPNHSHTVARLIFSRMLVFALPEPSVGELAGGTFSFLPSSHYHFSVPPPYRWPPIIHVSIHRSWTLDSRPECPGWRLT